MNNTIISALDEQFYIDCEVIETKYEYPQYTGVEKWIIITDLTEEELNSKYAEQIAPLRPYIILSRSFGEVRNDFRRNEKKHHMRSVRSCSSGKCLNDYKSNPEYIVRRLDPFENTKHQCDKCSGSGYDYIIYDRNTIRG